MNILRCMDVQGPVLHLGPLCAEYQLDVGGDGLALMGSWPPWVLVGLLRHMDGWTCEVVLSPHTF